MSAIRVVRPARPRARAAVSIAVVVVLVAAIGTAAALLYSAVSGAAGRLAVFFGIYLAMVALVLLAHRFDGLRKKIPLGFRRDRPLGQLVIGILLAVLLLSLVVGVPALAGADVGGIVGAGRNALWFALVSAVTVGVAEELMFRGYLLGRLRIALGSRAGAIIVSSALFGLLHLVNGDIVQVVVTACIGALLATARVIWPSCSLASVLVAHVLYDAGLALIGTAVAG
ncbi:CPBP family intramembrane glutamic endopeptidase [Microbacterium sp. SORGH_AS_0862]|uniref:CPBP family intramembrane glutamic endopeptidase n=1 Tax=Microbacterium sp. SORGH_AS_0862 TaxID=3041789 RepID=UPI00279178E7|nr:CPBP family intramembrane glutamic endopeptidase [Microbacterium sp. SORGH_AS_0862]MDQ1205362.1 membrane protease YdiL (CAAX protease family) [Microbacterium sp. SORGH_AS_0862]